ncbi:hypothetical protein HPT25_17160 [Bacillus sp. BRMEA1]|uniref:hypothetical protein n=1 Tax=Neobacillus endophyticus TaxID=2738405 RepID=UPI001564A1D0|nr:hypothetical protein [Neobacillus endophyticus]NRD79090.1 hypothetical protein [Neobacillus endophyticus]
MVKNLPLLMAMLVIGISTVSITLNTQMPEFIKIPLEIVGTVLNTWSLVALILHLGIKNLSKI